MAISKDNSYSNPDQKSKLVQLLPEEENDCYPQQLYLHIDKATDWNERIALEVCPSRGGGASHIMRRFKLLEIKR